MPLFSSESGLKKCAHQFERECRADDARSKAEHIRIIVLNALMRGIRVVAEPCADAANLVRRNRSSDAAAAYKDAALAIASGHSRADCFGEVGIVVGGVSVVSAEIDDLVTEPSDFFDDEIVQSDSCVIGGDRDAH